MKVFSAPLAALALVALFIGVACAQAQPAPKTKAALMCLIGQAPVGCDEALRDRLKPCGPALDPATCRPFIRTRSAFIHTQRCDSPDGSLGNECALGELTSVKYLGTQKSGYDVYEVAYRNNEETWVLSAEPNGQIHYVRFGGPLVRVMPTSMVAITAPANPVQVLFSQQG